MMDRIIKNPAVWFVAWIGLVYAYIYSIQNDLFTSQWNDVIFIVQLSADVLIGVFGFLAYRSRIEKGARFFYLLLFLSIIPGLFANEIYNILIYIIGIPRKADTTYYWSFAYTIFLTLQMVTWGYLFFNKQNSANSEVKKWITTYPYFQSAIILFLFLIYIVYLKSGTAQAVSIKTINSFIEITDFTLMSMCLSRTQNKSLMYVETGFLLLIGFNFAHRYSDILGSYFKAFDVVWMLCLIVIIQGLYKSYESGKNNIKFFDESSIHVLTSGAFVLFANFILAIFIAASIGISLLQADRLSNVQALILDIPSALIFAYTLTVLLAKYLAWRLSMPLDDIVRKVSNLTAGTDVKTVKTDKFKIHEVEMLDRFISQTVTELHQANKVKSEFLMNMSHDFRTPASGIMNMSRYIHDQMQDGDLKPLQKLVVNSSEQLMTLLEDVLDYSRLENDKLTVDVVEFDLIQLLDEVISFMQAKIKDNNLTVIKQYCKDEMNYLGDRVIVKRIVINLLSNAVKFTSTGSITVSISSEQIKNRKYIKISIQDTGVGIANHHLEKIFEPFFRIAPSELSNYPGIGLGLSNVKLMIKKIGGSIEVVSTLGVGSIFSILLPSS